MEYGIWNFESSEFSCFLIPVTDTVTVTITDCCVSHTLDPGSRFAPQAGQAVRDDTFF